MPFEILHFRDSARVIHDRGMTSEITETLQYIENVLFRSFYRGNFLKTALEDMGWRENGLLRILDGRRYEFKGFRNRIAIEANLYVYEYLWDGLFRLQLGYDHGSLDCGLLLLSSQRSERSPLGTSQEIVTREIEALYPTISLPVSIVLFDLGTPRHTDEAELAAPLPQPQTHHTQEVAA